MTRGGDPLFMDPMEEPRATAPDLARAVPASGYCLVVPGEQYLVFLPGGRPCRVDLAAATGSFASEWLDPATGACTAGARVDAGRSRVFEPPWTGDAVLFAWMDRGGS